MPDLADLSILAVTQAVSLWTPTLLKHLGIGVTAIGALAAIPTAVSILAIFIVGRSSDRSRLNAFEPYAWLKHTLEKLPSYPLNCVHELLPLSR